MRVSRRTLLGFAGTSAALAATTATPFGRQTLALQTPETSASTNAALLEVASYLPLPLLTENSTDGRELMIFNDYAQRFASVGVDPWSEPDPDAALNLFVSATMPMAASDLTIATIRAEDPLALFGWTIDQLDQEATVMAGSGVTTLTVLKGRFDEQSLLAAWQAEGYLSRETAGITAYSLHEDVSIDLESQIGQLVLSRANNVALVDANTLIYASTLPALTAMLEASQGSIASLASNQVVQSVVEAVPEPLTNAIVLPMAAFIAPIPISFDMEELQAIELAEPGPLPTLAVVGLVSGPEIPDRDAASSSAERIPSGSKLIAVRRFTTPNDAEQAARRTWVTLETGSSDRTDEPWSATFADWRVDIDVETSTVVTELDLFENESIWNQLIFARDAWFLYG